MGGPSARPHGFYGLGPRRAESQAESKMCKLQICLIKQTLCLATRELTEGVEGWGLELTTRVVTRLVPGAWEASELWCTEAHAWGSVPNPVGLAARQKEDLAKRVGLRRTSTPGPLASSLQPSRLFSSGWLIKFNRKILFIRIAGSKNGV